MKKLLPVFTAALLGCSGLMAQQNAIESNPMPRQFKDGSGIIPAEIEKMKLNRRTAGNGWYNAVSDARGAGESYVYYGDVVLWPDSLPVLRYTDQGGKETINNLPIHGLGSILDPKADYYPTRLTNFQNYTVDSIYFVYKYYNPVPDHTDSLFINIMTDTSFTRLRFISNNQPTYSTRVSGYTPTSGVRQYAFKLDTSNNTPNFFVRNSGSFSGAQEIALDPPISIKDRIDTTNTGLFGFTMHIKPNYSYNMGDTMIYGNDTSRAKDPVNKISAFQPLVMVPQSNLESTKFFNYALVNWSFVRYNGANTFYQPTNSPGNQRWYLFSGFHVNYFNLGNKRFENTGADISNVYPNPAAKNSDLMVQVKLKQASDVAVDIFNVQGQKVKTITKQHFAAGTSNISFNVAELPAGSYFVRMSGSFGSVSQAMLLK